MHPETEYYMSSDTVRIGAFAPEIAKELSVGEHQAAAVLSLLEDGATVPFIARYRKEATGGLDEVKIISIRDRAAQLEELSKRREAILKSLTEQEKLTPELDRAVRDAKTLSALEDLYLPYRPKRRTRAVIAKEKGLEPLADLLAAGATDDPEAAAAPFVNAENGVANAEEALSGARDIIAERMSEDAAARDEIRKLFRAHAFISSKAGKKKDGDAAKYADYASWSESAREAPSHRVLAMLRGEREGYLSVHARPDDERAVGLLERRFVKGPRATAAQLGLAVRDGYDRLLAPSMENELLQELRSRAETEAIRVFAENLRELLLAPPLGRKAVLAVDPGLRTGCKVVCLDRQGKLLEHTAVFPLEPHRREREAAAEIKKLVKKHDIEAIAVGNGTGGREAIAFLKSLDLGGPVPVIMVNESGASVYSASETARKEFPEHDVTVRGAVSIGRRLMDPLSELVKIDPKSIGVGQYQHDVDQKALKAALDDVVVSCVNAVGVELNTASAELLRYVSGLSERLARTIVEYRNANGPFGNRNELLAVSGMGPKTFEQAAGFLRIRDGDNPLDASAVHPESYRIVERMANDLSVPLSGLIGNRDLVSKIRLAAYVGGQAGLPTLTDIAAELAKPGRDPREPFERFEYAESVHTIGDLAAGMTLPGIVTNVTNFGAFVDIGVHQDGLVHISELADRYVTDAREVVRVNQKVTVTVLAVDTDRKRISLSMKRR